MARTPTLLQLCLLALVAPAQAGPVLANPGPAYPRCTPVAPSSGLTVTDPTVEDLPADARNGIDLAPYGEAWAVGDGGTVYARSPGGLWVAQETGVTADLHAVTQTDQGDAWFVGDGGLVLHRSRAGGLFRRVEFPAKEDLRTVQFAGPFGAIAGSDGSWFRTQDAGATWKRQPGKATALAVTHGVIAAGSADGSVEVQIQSGADWMVQTHKPEGADAIRSLVLRGPTQVVALDAAGALHTTLDSGTTWRRDTVKGEPVKQLLMSALGMLAIRTGGAVAWVDYGVQTTLRDTYPAASGGRNQSAKLPSPPPGLRVVRADTDTTGVAALTEDGRLYSLGMVQWSEPGHPCGRPFEVAGEARLAPTTTVGAPVAVSPEHAALAAAWLVDAQAEHASVASFARYTLRLLAVGAPAALLDDAQRAMADELVHAELCYALASRFAGQTLAPGPLDVGGALDGGESLAALAVEVLREGAVGETVGAAIAAEMLAGAVDPQVVAALERIAPDEARHAQVAWRFLRWAVDTGGEPVRGALADALESAVGAHRVAVGPVGGMELSAYGRLDPSALRRVVDRTLDHVVLPCAKLLLGGSEPEARDPRPIGD